MSIHANTHSINQSVKSTNQSISHTESISQLMSLFFLWRRNISLCPCLHSRKATHKSRAVFSKRNRKSGLHTALKPSPTGAPHKVCASSLMCPCDLPAPTTPDALEAASSLGTRPQFQQFRGEGYEQDIVTPKTHMSLMETGSEMRPTGQN